MAVFSEVITFVVVVGSEATVAVAGVTTSSHGATGLNLNSYRQFTRFPLLALALLPSLTLGSAIALRTSFSQMNHLLG